MTPKVNLVRIEAGNNHLHTVAGRMSDGTPSSRLSMFTAASRKEGGCEDEAVKLLHSSISTGITPYLVRQQFHR